MEEPLAQVSSTSSKQKWEYRLYKVSIASEVAATHNKTHACQHALKHPALSTSLPSTTTQQTQGVVGKMAQEVRMV